MLHPSSSASTYPANGALHCLSIHGFVRKNENNLSDEAILASRRGRSTDAKADAALRFARAIIETRGSVGDDEVRAVRDAGSETGRSPRSWPTSR